MKFSTSSSRASSLATLLGVLGAACLPAACASGESDDSDSNNIAATGSSTDTSNTGMAPPITSGTLPAVTTTAPGATTAATNTTASVPPGASSSVAPSTDPSMNPSAPATSAAPTVTGADTTAPVDTTEPAGTDDTGAGGAPAPDPSSTTPAPSSTVVNTPGNQDHCLYGYDPEPSDDTMAAGPSIFMGGGQPDTILQPEVLQWMDDKQWTGAHVVWHAVRGCKNGSAGGLLAPLGLPDLCADFPFLIPEDQNCQSAGDGYQFLLFHRHMMESLKQLWPKHAADFAGFDKFPTTKEELPEVWNETDPTWNDQILAAAEIADHIEDNLDLFPDEGALGFWLQCPVGQRAPSFAPNMPYIGIHFNLHDEWSRGAGSAHGLNNGQVNITNYMFWKLHGWIDNVWEKYRVAKGLTDDPAAVTKYKSDLAESCREMDTEIEILQTMGGEPPVFDCPPEADESGVFHDTVRPIFEGEVNHCASCHGPAQTSPYADLTLGGQISSKCLVERLKRASTSGGQFNLVEPGEPENSWLYLKAAGLAEESGCIDGAVNVCNPATMPPGGKTVTEAELETLYNWIKEGAN